LTRFLRRGASKTKGRDWGRETVGGGATDRWARRLGDSWGKDATRLGFEGGALGSGGLARSA
jgi:hypothetical protein